MGLFDVFQRKTYDFTTIEGIRAIPLPRKKETKMHDPKEGLEYQLQRLATQYKKEGKMALAIECLKKSNDLMPYSIFAYTRRDYERLVEFLKEARRFDEARAESQRLDMLYGTELQMLEYYMSLEPTKKARDEYMKNVIIPKKIEMQNRTEYDWLWEHLPDKAPKSFGGYVRMKNANTDNYQKLLKFAAEKTREMLAEKETSK